MQLDATHAQKQIYYSWHIVFSQDIILDDSGRIWLHLQQDFHDIVSGKCYIMQLDATHAQKEIYYSWHIVFSKDILLDDSGRIWMHYQ